MVTGSYYLYYKILIKKKNTIFHPILYRLRELSVKILLREQWKNAASGGKKIGHFISVIFLLIHNLLIRCFTVS